MSMQEPQKQKEQTGEVIVDTTGSDSVGVEIDGADEVMAEVDSLAEGMEVDDFTAPRSNINHGHDLDKHDVRSAFGVTDELVKEFFMYAPNDHAAIHEMLSRKEEFISADVPVFKDTSDTDENRWNKIKNRASSAPVPDETHRDLESLSKK